MPGWHGGCRRMVLPGARLVPEGIDRTVGSSLKARTQAAASCKIMIAGAGGPHVHLEAVKVQTAAVQLPVMLPTAPVQQMPAARRPVAHDRRIVGFETGQA